MQYTLNYRNNYLDISLYIPKKYLVQAKTLCMPRYIPGSYMLRDFACNIVDIYVIKNNNKIKLYKISHSEWQLEAFNEDIEIIYTLYAKDNSVRGNFCDSERVLVNGAASFLYIKDLQDVPHTLIINNFSDWHIHTALAYKNYQYYHEFYANNYDMLIDYPILITRENFYQKIKIDSKHQIVFAGEKVEINANIIKSIENICYEQNKFFNTLENNKNIEFDEYKTDMDYLFITQVGHNLYGGLEHRASTVLQTTPDSLNINNRDKYIDFLGLCSHEYFHSWWVKRVKPQAFINPSFLHELDTKLLWIFEGFTSYYDNLFLYKAKCITLEEYLKLIQDNINSIYKYEGHNHQSLNDSSIDAWIKYYKPTPNSLNTNTSYYTKGALLALCLDLYIRKNTDNKFSLDTVVKFLWEKYGRNFYDVNTIQTGLTYESFLQNIQLCTSLNLDNILNSWVFNTSLETELPFLEYLQHFDINVNIKVENKIDWGLQYKSNILDNNIQSITIEKIFKYGLGDLADLSIGDIVISINKQPIEKDINNNLLNCKQGDEINILYWRNRQLIQKLVECNYKTSKLFELSINKNFHNKINGWLC